ncbi:hypothetical protein RRG08_067278 [Elysia crispata]|uniref:Uncharacterized protein n=1 Tax=Elysia crispata TaxID=231223 RepID=A0AAE1DD42_9GAST|nr:hypothetical protein RRG08_067278 [Elysia crispata]
MGSSEADQYGISVNLGRIWADVQGVYKSQSLERENSTLKLWTHRTLVFNIAPLDIRGTSVQRSNSRHTGRKSSIHHLSRVTGLWCPTYKIWANRTLVFNTPPRDTSGIIAQQCKSRHTRRFC